MQDSGHISESRLPRISIRPEKVVFDSMVLINFEGLNYWTQLIIFHIKSNTIHRPDLKKPFFEFIELKMEIWIFHHIKNAEVVLFHDFLFL